jgi:methionyl aminopeptidase
MRLFSRHFTTTPFLRNSIQKSAQKFGNYEVLLPNLEWEHRPNTVPNHIQKPNYSQIEPLSAFAEIPIHTEQEIQGIRRACLIAREVLDMACSQTRPGMTTLDIDKMVHEEIIRRNAYPSPLLYHGFPKSICTSVNNVLVHGIPDNRQLLDGDIVNIDITVYSEGFHGDTSRTVGIGSIDDRAQHLIEHNRKALELAIQVVRPGVPFQEIGRVIEAYAKQFHYTVDRSFCGHGIGRHFHQPPLILHHENDEKDLMQEGMVFTIEPIFCQGTAGFIKWPDGWTAVSRDGSRSAQHEHTILVTERGAEILT